MCGNGAVLSGETDYAQTRREFSKMHVKRSNQKKSCIMFLNVWKHLNIFQIRWKAKKGDENNGGYSHDALLAMLEKVREWCVICSL